MTRMVAAAYRHVPDALVPWRTTNFAGRGKINLIDVGAAGPLPSPWRNHAWHVRHLLRFEPLDEYRRANRSITTFDAALWEKAEERDFYIAEHDNGSASSLMRQNVPYVRAHYEELRRRGDPQLAATWFERVRVDRVERVHCRTLDDVLDELAPEGVRYHFLKVDTQGADYYILKGAESFLRNQCLGVHAEIFTVPMYEDVVLLPEFVAYLDGLGFQLVKKYPAHGTFASQHDCIFLRRGARGELMDLLRRLYHV